VFAACDGLVFIASTGIAVRLCAPLLRDKTRDPAVVVVDDLGRYAISLLSGHLGGANALAANIADIIGAQPIITTASDGRGFEAVDLLAQRYNLAIDDLDEVKTITALMVAEQPIALVSDIPVTWHYPHRVEGDAAGWVYISSLAALPREQPSCLLRPRTLHVGVGCRRGTPAAAILAAIRAVFEAHNLAIESIAALASIDIKHDEGGLIEAAASLGLELRLYSKAEIQRVCDAAKMADGAAAQFAVSPFVQATLGVPGVCEPCACLSGGELIVKKTCRKAVTVAVARARALTDVRLV
jgi:cobalt-precorrin 5A hydrolase